MNFFEFAFSSIYDQASLLVMAIGLGINVIIDIVRTRSKTADT